MRLARLLRRSPGFLHSPSVRCRGWVGSPATGARGKTHLAAGRPRPSKPAAEPLAALPAVGTSTYATIDLGPDKEGVKMRPTTRKRVRVHTRRDPPVPYADPSVLADDSTSFASCGVSSLTENLLKRAGYQRPTRVQAEALPVLLRDRDGIIAAETGSGKTLAYLIPIVERVFREDPTTIADPIAAVVVPTQELVQQVHRVVKTVFPLLDPFVRVAYANVGPPRRDRFAVVIATPKALRENVRDARLAHLRLLVLDEADLLLDGDYARDTKQWLLTQQRSRSARAQMIFAAATVPDRGARSVRGFLDRFFKDATSLQLDSVHHINPRILRRHVALALDERHFDRDAAIRAAKRAMANNHAFEAEPGPHDIHLHLRQLELHRRDLVRDAKNALLLRELRLTPPAIEDAAAPADKSGTVTSSLPSSEGSAASGGGPPLPQGHSAPSAPVDETDASKAGTRPRPTEVLTETVDPSAPIRLRSLAKEDAQRVQPTIIFVNSVQSAQETEALLRHRAPDLSVGALHKKVPDRKRSQVVQDFLNGAIRVLIATDIGARGLDTLHVAHVIHLDFPTNAVAYLHRTGRTGRLGRPGVVTAFVAPEDRDLARAISEAEDQGKGIQGAFSSRRMFRRSIKRRSGSLPRSNAEDDDNDEGDDGGEEEFEEELSEPEEDGSADDAFEVDAGEMKARRTEGRGSEER